MFLFGLVGPIAVFVTLAWVARLVRAYARTSAELAAVNLDLESKVAERTHHLEQVTSQLADRNAEFAAANADLLKLDRLKSEFVSLVSHQLRAPLTNIRGALEIVGQDAAVLPPPSRRTLEILAIESERLLSLIKTILDVSRIEAGRLSPNMGPVALEPLLDRSCAATLGAHRDRPWSLEVGVAVPPVWADELLLEEVVRNLLENAVRYSPPLAPVEVHAPLDGPSIIISVTDHGLGVPAEEQGLIFGSFHQLGAADTTVRGYGLGLYFADRLIRAMGGEIAVESPVWPVPDAPGSRFLVTLPVAADAPPGSDDGSRGRLMALLLLIDDDSSLAELLSAYLGRIGHQVRVASDGRMGLEAIAAAEPDLVLLDVTMPGLDGWQVLARIRALSTVPVVMLTARGDEAEVLRGFDGGADDYVTKPFSFAQLAARIKAVTERTSQDRGGGATVLRGADLVVDTVRHSVLRSGMPVELTPTEFSILVTLLREPGRVLSPRQIVAAVWGAEYADETGYIRRYVWHLRQKLEPDAQHPRYILNERGVGYVFPAVSSRRW